MEEAGIVCRECKHNGSTGLEESISESSQASFMEHRTAGINQLTIYEGIPLVLLALEAASGLACNLVTLLLYLRKRRLVQNAGNLFTINLAMIDLLMCGVAIPVTMAVQLLPSSTGKHLNNLCFADRSLLLFLAIASATGTSLLALDRGDISLRASKRFFVKRRPLVAVWIVWFLCLATTVIPLLSMMQYDGVYGPDVSPRRNISLSLLSGRGLQELGTSTADVTCTATCWKNLCALTKLDLSLQVGFQVSVFAMSAILLITVYLRILQSVTRRNYKQAKKIGGQQLSKMTSTTNNNKKKSFILRGYTCCKWGSGASPEITMTEVGKDNEKTKNSPPIIVQNVRNEKTPLKSLQSSKQSSVEESSISGSQAHLLSAPKSEGEQRKQSECRTDFASVALSITVVLALKRMVAAKMKEKRKRMRHLRKMTILILLAFLLCWTPFHALPVIKLIAGPGDGATDMCANVKCSVNDTELTFRIALSGKTDEEAIWNCAFLWSLALAAVTCTLNPMLYSFSREKIRKDLKTMCASKRDKVKFVTSSRGRLRISAVWSSPWGRNKGNVNRVKEKNTPSPTEPTCKRHDKIFRTNTIEESSSAHDTSDKLLTKSSLSIIEQV